MTKNEIIEIIKQNTLEILPELKAEQFNVQDSLKNLGANSIDRMDIIVQSMDMMKIKIPMVEFKNVSNIQELVDLFHAKLA